MDADGGLFSQEERVGSPAVAATQLRQPLLEVCHVRSALDEKADRLPVSQELLEASVQQYIMQAPGGCGCTDAGSGRNGAGQLKGSLQSESNPENAETKPENDESIVVAVSTLSDRFEVACVSSGTVDDLMLTIERDQGWPRSQQQFTLPTGGSTLLPDMPLTELPSNHEVVLVLQEDGSVDEDSSDVSEEDVSEDDVSDEDRSPSECDKCDYENCHCDVGGRCRNCDGNGRKKVWRGFRGGCDGGFGEWGLYDCEDCDGSGVCSACNGPPKPSLRS